MPWPGQPLGSNTSHSLGLQTQSHPRAAPATTTTANIASHLPLVIMSLTSQFTVIRYGFTLSLHDSQLSISYWWIDFHSGTKYKVSLIQRFFFIKRSSGSVTVNSFQFLFFIMTIHALCIIPYIAGDYTSMQLTEWNSKSEQSFLDQKNACPVGDLKLQ